MLTCTSWCWSVAGKEVLEARRLVDISGRAREKLIEMTAATLGLFAKLVFATEEVDLQSDSLRGRENWRILNKSRKVTIAICRMHYMYVCVHYCDGRREVGREQSVLPDCVPLKLSSKICK